MSDETNTTDSSAEEELNQEPAETAENDSAELDPIAKLEEERDQFRDQFLRTAAEMENVRKRVQREREEERKYSKLSMIAELLPAMDNLQRAIDSAAKEENPAGLLQGVEMVLKQFEEILKRNGAEPIEALGEPFDPNFHEAVQQRPDSEHPPMTVVEVLQKGVKLHERVIRPSQVIVSTEATE